MVCLVNFILCISFTSYCRSTFDNQQSVPHIATPDWKPQPLTEQMIQPSTVALDQQYGDINYSFDDLDVFDDPLPLILDLNEEYTNPASDSQSTSAHTPSIASLKDELESLTSPQQSSDTIVPAPPPTYGIVPTSPLSSQIAAEEKETNKRRRRKRPTETTKRMKRVDRLRQLNVRNVLLKKKLADAQKSFQKGMFDMVIAFNKQGKLPQALSARLNAMQAAPSS